MRPIRMVLPISYYYVRPQLTARPAGAEASPGTTDRLAALPLDGVILGLGIVGSLMFWLSVVGGGRHATATDRLSDHLGMSVTYSHLSAAGRVWRQRQSYSERAQLLSSVNLVPSTGLLPPAQAGGLPSPVRHTCSRGRASGAG
jgi:hypothetical protein